MDYEKKGRDDGERDGFQDGLDNKPIRPSPALAPSLASIVYLHAYTAAYEVAYVNGGKARDTILSWRANVEQVLDRGVDMPERDDV